MKDFLILFLLSGFILNCSSSNKDKKTEEDTITNPKYGPWQEKESPISFELVQTFGEENGSSETLISSTRSIQTIVIDESSNVYFLDSRSNKLFSFTKDGNLRWKIDKEGRGPGDISTSYDFTWNKKDKLYLLNISSTRLDEFDLKGNFIASNNFSKLKNYGANTIEYISPDRFLLASPIEKIYAAKIQIINFDTDSLVESSFQIKPLPEIKIPAGFYRSTPVKILENQIVLGSDHFYGFHIYSLQGEKIKTVTRKTNANVTPAVVIAPPPASNSFSILGESYPPLKLNDKFYVHQNKWATNIDDPSKFLKDALDRKDRETPNFKYSIDILDKNLALLYSYEYTKENDIGIIKAIDHEGFIYTVSDTPYPQIRKYKISINE